MLLNLLGAIGGIVLVDLALSGDNALVIGVAAAALPSGQRRTAILAGGAIAIVLRILFAIAATFLLRLPYLQAIGGVALLYIAVRMLLDRSKEERYAREERFAHEEPAGGTDATEGGAKQRRRARKAKATTGQTTLFAALLTIVVADLTMSLDNVLAIGALANGNLIVLSVGLLVSVSLLLLGSALVAAVMGRLPWLLDLATFVLAWTAGNMFVEDTRIGPYLKALPGPSILIPIALVFLMIIVDILLRVIHRRRHAQRPAHDSTHDPAHDPAHASVH